MIELSESEVEPEILLQIYVHFYGHFMQTKTNHVQLFG